ncbi:MAG: tRNA uridine-5-carboxymethylaminomethyl(34) synthesis GTPase MnmE [Proteobacteria bacterium]|nr:tRNA uridine-5-carboxymethylaminomethyl(34) synthesis GTPase MnmE [Pseudomonadota bacterium]
MTPGDTIFALSSAPGRAGVAVVRVSGPDAGAALEALAGPRPPERRAALARLSDPRSGVAIDRGLVLWLPGPRSFTGEDMAELHLHGGRAVIAAALEALAAVPGLRPAEAGEFTRRAFDNGKLDLSEVEGLADLIAAETEAQRRQALRQMEGALSRRTEDWRAGLIGALAHAEAAIDFPDEELPQDLQDRLDHKILWLQQELAQYLDDRHCGERLRDGLYVAIIGPPNAGKSTLLNALARRPVAIVSEVAGTTRDVIEVHLDLGGYPVTLADTAGLRTTESEAGASGQAAVEAEGIRRARAHAAAADLKLAVFDLREATAGGGADGPARAAQDPPARAANDASARPGRDPPVLDPATLAFVDADTLVVLNKCDLVSNPARIDVGGVPGLPISAKTGAGMTELLTRLEAEVEARLGGGGASAAVTRVRHRRALEDCAAALERAAAACAPELVAEDLRLALRALGRITGRVDVEDVLDAIFRDFCIGK